ncbi:hypothetical protein BpHYR1_014812, partial [Brachionus plicatilis]
FLIKRKEFKKNLQKKYSFLAACNFISNGFKLSLGFISDILFGIIEVLDILKSLPRRKSPPLLDCSY